MQPIQTDPQPTDTDDPLVRDIVQFRGPAAVDAHHQGRPYCFGDIRFAALSEPLTDASVYFAGQTEEEPT